MADNYNADKTFNLVKKLYEKSGANIGPRQPIPSDMVKRINEDMDKMGIGGKKTSKAKGGVIKKYAKGGDVAGKKDPRRPAGDTGIADIYTAEKGQPPMDPDMGSARSSKPVKKANGGKISSASSRGDGCAVKGKTKGRMV